jgi:AcrR family transcriptional regulator
MLSDDEPSATGHIPLTVAVSRPSSTRLPAARRRRQLLDVAQEVFADKGFHVTSMDDVAEAAGVTKPVLYQHFASKRELYLQLLEDVGGRLMQAVTSAVDRAEGPHQQVEAGFAAYFRFVALQSSAFRLLFGSGARRDEEFSDAVRRVEDAIVEAVAPLIEADLEPDHQRALAYGIVGLAEAASRHWVSTREEAGVPPDRDVAVKEGERLARRISELAWAGLRGVHRD